MLRIERDSEIMAPFLCTAADHLRYVKRRQKKKQKKINHAVQDKHQDKHISERTYTAASKDYIAQQTEIF